MPKDTTTAVSTPDSAETPSNSKRSAARFITPVLALVAAVGVGIFGGVLIGQNTASAATPAGFAGGPQGTTQGGAQTGGFGGNFTSGEITAVDGDTVTLTLDDGSTITVTTSSDTSVTVSGEVSDLAKGDTVTVIGEADDDGNVTATSISEGTGGLGGFGGGTPPTAAPTDQG